MMVLRLIFNILTVVGVLTLALIVLALWAYFSDEQEIYEVPPIIDMTELAHAVSFLITLIFSIT